MDIRKFFRAPPGAAGATNAAALRRSDTLELPDATPTPLAATASAALVRAETLDLPAETAADAAPTSALQRAETIDLPDATSTAERQTSSAKAALQRAETLDMPGDTSAAVPAGAVAPSTGPLSSGSLLKSAYELKREARIRVRPMPCVLLRGFFARGDALSGQSFASQACCRARAQPCSTILAYALPEAKPAIYPTAWERQSQTAAVSVLTA